MSIARSIAALTIALAGCPDEHDTADPDSGPLGPIPFDAGYDDARVDAPPRIDAGPMCDIGEMCTAARGCRVSSTCLPEQSDTLGPVTGLPGGATTVGTTAWMGGYCTEVAPIDAGGCDPDVEDSCGACGACLRAGTDAMGRAFSLCARRCAPSVTENDCRDGYQCVLGDDACLPGCSSDEECAVYETDTDGDGEGDALVYDAASMWTCNPVTFRCEHVPAPDAEAGTACTRDAECELRGRCLDGSSGAWPDGYCIKLGCDVPGNECAGDGVCTSRAFGLPVCLAPCEVGASATPDDPFSPPRDCRAGYACMWDGESGAGAGNGACIPGEFNEVRTANVGASCADESTCRSPFGLARCSDFDGEGAGGGYCTVIDCAAPGIDPATACGEGAVCASVASSSTTLCLSACESAADCTAGYGCWDTSMAGIATGGRAVCFAGCLEDAHCRDGETCEGVSATTAGACR